MMSGCCPILSRNFHEINRCGSLIRLVDGILAMMSSTPHTILPQKPTRGRVTLSVWLAAAAAIAYLCRNCIVVAEKTIRDDVGLTEQQMGHVMGLFFWCYALAQIPSGLLGERFGSRRVLPIISVMWSLAMVIWGFATGMFALMLGRVSTGIAQAGLFPCSANSISHWYPKTERGTVSGFLGSAMHFGAVIAAPLTAVLLEYMTWRTVFVLYSIPGLLWSVGFWIWFRDDPQDHPAVNDEELELIEHGREPVDRTGPRQPLAMPWSDLIVSRKMWMICGQQFFRAAAYVWFASWFATYLQETREVTRAASGWLTAVPLLASMVASFVSGGLSDSVLRRTGSRAWARKGVAIISLSICSVLVFSAYFIADATLATVVIGAGAFFAGCAGPCAYAVTIDMGGRHVASVFSTMNMIGNFGAAILAGFAPAFRSMVEHNATLLAISGGNSWNATLVLFGSMYVLAVACWLMLNTDGTVFDDGDDRAAEVTSEGSNDD
jgi:sugar phosphate permease